MTDMVHLIKLSVGSESVEDIINWQKRRKAELGDKDYAHVTRMWPRREADILNGGSIYWVVSGLVQCRQRILRLDEFIGKDGIRRCGIVLDPVVHRTEIAPRRPFQGWRYLKPEDAPRDLAKTRAREDSLPPQLSAALADIGVR